MANNNQVQNVTPADFIEDDYISLIRDFCDENNVDDLRKASQSVFTAALMYIQMHLYPDREIFRLHKNIINPNNIMPSTYYIYDFNILNAVCDKYIYICNIYSKIVTIDGFSKLTGISYDTIIDWGITLGRKVSAGGTAIYKRLSGETENTLTARLVSFNNPLGTIAVLNRYDASNGAGMRQTGQLLSASELPKLGQIGTQLDGKQALEVCENDTQFE